MDDIRAVFSLQSEVFTILARQDAKIASFDDLKGKRVNIGNPGSGQRDTFEEIMTREGLGQIRVQPGLRTETRRAGHLRWVTTTSTP